MISLLLFSVLSFSNNVSAIYSEPGFIREHSVTTEGPAYFFRPSPDGRYIGYSLGHANLLLDTLSGVTLPVPGKYDPVFLLNTRLLVVPEPIRFFKVDDLLTQQTAAPSILADAGLQGVYQSVGILRQTAEEVHYRLIIEYGAQRTYRDFKETLSANGNTENFETMGEVQTVCTNHNFALPIISKNGLELGGLDHTAGKSRIYKFNDDGSCDVVKELGLVTGKIAFSYDNRYVAFHVFDKLDPANARYAFGYIGTPNSSTVANIYLLDRKLDKLYKLSNYADANAMYPEFLANGNIMYVAYPHDRQANKPKFIEVRPTIY